MISKIIKGTGMQGLVSYAMDGDHRAIIGGKPQSLSRRDARRACAYSGDRER